MTNVVAHAQSAANNTSTNWERELLLQQIKTMERFDDKILNTVFSHYDSSLEAGLGLGWEWTISGALEKIEECIKNGATLWRYEKQMFADYEARIPKPMIPLYRRTKAVVDAAPLDPEDTEKN